MLYGSTQLGWEMGRCADLARAWKATLCSSQFHPPSTCPGVPKEVVGPQQPGHPAGVHAPGRGISKAKLRSVKERKLDQ